MTTFKTAQPSGLYLLTFAEFWDRFSYYGIQAMLVLYLTKQLMFTDQKAYSLYGIFTALAYATTVIGGIIADRIIGFRRAVIFGALLMVMGNLILLLPDQQWIYLGLTVIVCGIGFFKPNNASFVGALYSPNNSAKRTGGYSIFYIGMNAGALTGPLVYGFLTEKMGWRYGFAASAIGVLSTLILFFIKDKLLTQQLKVKALLINQSRILGVSRSQIVYLSTALAIGALTLLMQYNSLFSNLLTLTGCCTLLGLFLIAAKCKGQERRYIIGISILSFFSIFFFACTLQTATTLTLFIERHVNRNVLGLQIPTMMFLSLQPFCIILIAPFISKLWDKLANLDIEPSPNLKVALGLLLGAASFAVFYLAVVTNTAQNQLTLIFILLGNFLLGLGELCIIPVIMTSIARFVPERLCSTMMGIFFMSLTFSGYLAGIIAKLTTSHKLTVGKQMAGADYSYAFTQIGIISAAIGVVMLLLNPWLKQLFHIEDRK